MPLKPVVGAVLEDSASATCVDEQIAPLCSDMTPGNEGKFDLLVKVT